MRFIATCKIGLESVVSLELRRLGIEVERVEDARVLFLGDYQTMAKACLWLSVRRNGCSWRWQALRPGVLRSCFRA